MAVVIGTFEEKPLTVTSCLSPSHVKGPASIVGGAIPPH